MPRPVVAGGVHQATALPKAPTSHPRPEKEQAESQVHASASKVCPPKPGQKSNKSIKYKLVSGTDGTAPGDRVPKPNVPSCQFTSMGLRDQLGPQALERVEDAVRAGSAHGRRPWRGPPPRRGQGAVGEPGCTYVLSGYPCNTAAAVTQKGGDRAALNGVEYEIIERTGRSSSCTVGTSGRSHHGHAEWPPTPPPGTSCAIAAVREGWNLAPGTGPTHFCYRARPECPADSAVCVRAKASGGRRRLYGCAPVASV